jgi:RNA-dependent RNA polymerase
MFENESACIYALNRIMYEETHNNNVSKTNAHKVLEKFTNYFYSFPRLEAQKFNRYQSENFSAIGKVFVTPLKVIFSGPHYGLNNRIVRVFKKKEEHFIQVTFCDEDMNVVYGGYRGAHPSVYARIRKILEDGITIGNRKYEFLLFTSSQVRHASAWFLDVQNSGMTIESVLSCIGNASNIQCVGHYASALGQALSSTFQCKELLKDQVFIEQDIYSDDKKFNFTNGSGMICEEFANEIAQSLNLRSKPSAFQVRYKGFKGMLQVSKSAAHQNKVIFRKSMLKFDGNGSNLEVCSFALGNRCFLNRQIIVLLTALGICDRLILDRYNEHVSLLLNARKDSTSALNFLESVTIGCYVPHQQCLIYAFLRTERSFFAGWITIVVKSFFAEY